MPLNNRYTQILQGAMVLTGNAMQIRGTPNFPPAGNDFVNGSYISINNALVAAAGFPAGTTFLGSQSSASAILNIASGSTVEFAQLFWVTTSAANPNASIIFRTPLGDNTVSPNTALNQISATNTWLAQDVRSIVAAAGSGIYTVLTNPGANIVNGSSINGACWSLIVVYRNPSMRYRYFNINTGFSNVSSGAPSDFTFSNIVTPSSGTVNGYLLVSEVFGDLGDAARILVGTSLATAAQVGNTSTGTWNGVAPYAQINNMLPGNILIADCNDTNIGLLDTRGTFGTYNKNPFNTTAPSFARNITDILGLDISNRLTNNQTTLFTRVTYGGTGSGTVTSQSVQIDVNSADVDMTKTVDKGYARINDTLTYTIAIKNSGLANANNVFFVDTVPSGTSFISGSFAANGVTIPSASISPPGVNLQTLPNNSTLTVTFKVKVKSTIPTPNPVLNTAQTTFNFIPGTGLAPVFTDATSNIAQTTIVSAILASSKVATPQVGIFDTITYTIPISNIGNTTAVNVLLIDTLPATVSFEAGSITQDGTPISGNPNPPGVTLNNILGGRTSTVSFRVTVLTIPTPNTIVNAATSNYSYEVSGGASLTNAAISSNIASTTVNFARLTTTKYVNKSYANIGDTINYTLVIKNTGVVTAINIVLIDTIPNDTSLVSGTFKQDGNNLSGTPNPPGTTLPNNLAVNRTTTVTFSVVVNTIPNPNPIPNNATESFQYVGNPEGPTIKTDTSSGNTVFTQVNNANLSNAVKYVDKSYADCGDSINYTIVIPNTGNITAQNVVFNDTIPSGTIFITDSVFINGSRQLGVNPNTGVTIPNIAPGSTTTINFSVKVNC